MKRLIILGAGGYGRTVADVADQTGVYSDIFFLDDLAQNAAVLGKCMDFQAFADGNTDFIRLLAITKAVEIGSFVCKRQAVVCL